MCPTIEVSDDVFYRLEKHVIGFDTPSNVINRLIDNYEKTQPNTNNKEKKASNVESVLRIFSNKEIQQRISTIAETLPENELELLCEAQFSKDTFGISFPLFIKVNAIENQATKKNMVKTNDGVNRWTWKFEFIKSGFSYGICTQWYPKNDLAVKEWLDSHTVKHG
jgi:predicted CopG family antitoxin